MRLPVFLTLCSSLLLASAASFAAETGWQILIPGRYHDGDAPVQAGEDWLSLSVINGQWHLVPSKVQIKRVTDPLLTKEEPPTGIQIASNQADTLVLLRVPTLKAGKVATPNIKFKNQPRPLNTKPLELRFEREDYMLGMAQGGVYLHKGEQKTRLLELATENTALLWAGDLDGDRKLDFLFASKLGIGTCLYLSSLVDAGSMLKKLSCHPSATLP
jgi:hypothetical protein